MSVMQLGPESFLKNVAGITRFSPIFNYGRVIMSDEIRDTFLMLQCMNACSFAERYKEDMDLTLFVEVETTEKHHTLPALLKSLQCLYYNIEIDDMDQDEKDAYKVLHDYIEQITGHLISELDEYKIAQWG
jgi:hypothetical protein